MDVWHNEEKFTVTERSRSSEGRTAGINEERDTNVG
jgi:hypothetical protein